MKATYAGAASGRSVRLGLDGARFWLEINGTFGDTYAGRVERAESRLRLTSETRTSWYEKDPHGMYPAQEEEPCALVFEARVPGERSLAEALGESPEAIDLVLDGAPVTLRREPTPT